MVGPSSFLWCSPTNLMHLRMPLLSGFVNIHLIWKKCLNKIPQSLISFCLFIWGVKYRWFLSKNPTEERNERRKGRISNPKKPDEVSVTSRRHMLVASSAPECSHCLCPHVPAPPSQRGAAERNETTADEEGKEFRKALISWTCWRGGWGEKNSFAEK